MALTRDQLSNLKIYYNNMYGEEPKSDEEALVKLREVYQKVMLQQDFLPSEIKQGIAEKYRLLKSENLPAYYWMLEAFHVTSKKHPDKRSFNYIVGMLRNWQNFGFGYIPSNEEAELTEYIEDVIGIELSYEARRLLKGFIGAYGAIKVTRIIGNMNKGDASYVIVLLLGELLKQKFGERLIRENHKSFSLGQNLLLELNDLAYKTNYGLREDDLIESPLEYEPGKSLQWVTEQNSIESTRNLDSRNKTRDISITLEQNSSQKNKNIQNDANESGRKKGRETIAFKKKKEAELVETIINKNKAPMKSSELFKKLSESGIHCVEKTIASKMKTYMKYNPNIVKVDKGLYNIQKKKEEITIL